jgi:Spy/CpxP family protein refolding chaperone
MRKTILAIATIATLTVGNSFAQHNNRHGIPAVNNSRVDNAFEEFKINKLDEIVNLSRKQENKIKKIENHYDRLTSSNRRYSTYQGVQRLEQAKQKEILAVLTPAQRQRLFAYQHSGRFDNRRYNRRG